MLTNFLPNVISQDNTIRPIRAKKMPSASAVFARYHGRNAVGAMIAYAIGILRLRLGIPVAYAIIIPTVFRPWYLANTALADGIFFTLVGLMALSWLITLGKKFVSILA